MIALTRTLIFNAKVSDVQFMDVPESKMVTGIDTTSLRNPRYMKRLYYEIYPVAYIL